MFKDEGEPNVSPAKKNWRFKKKNRIGSLKTVNTRDLVESEDNHYGQKQSCKENVFAGKDLEKIAVCFSASLCTGRSRFCRDWRFYHLRGLLSEKKF